MRSRFLKHHSGCNASTRNMVRVSIQSNFPFLNYFRRAVAQRCPVPRMNNLITLSGQHQG